MTTFEIYTKEVEINGKTLKLRPLDGKHLPVLWSVMTESNTDSTVSEDKLKKMSEEEKAELVKGMFTEDNMTKIHKLCLHTMVRSYPEQNVDALEDFVSVNLMELFSAVTTLNMNSKE